MNSLEKIIFFDGHCNLCNGFIDFVIRWDSKQQFKVASLQGKTAEAVLDSSHIESLSSVVLLKGKEVHIKTNAVIRIISGLHWLLKPTLALLIIPSFIRDPFYNFIAKNRYKLFGEKETCRLPTPEEKDHFLP